MVLIEITSETLDSLRLLLINECWNPKIVADGEELAKNINQKKKPDVLQACTCTCEKCYRHYVNMIFLVNNLKGRQLFSDQMNGNRLI